jgi:hypothetical protein
MKALTIKQPWANMIVSGVSGGYRDKPCSWCKRHDCTKCEDIVERRKKHKTVEIRSWKTKHRGLLAIHTGMKINYRCRAYYHKYNISTEPRGFFLAITRLVVIFEYTEDDHFRWDIGRHGLWRKPQYKKIFGWQLEDIKKLANPIPYRGRQGLFDVPDNLFPPEHLEV